MQSNIIVEGHLNSEGRGGHLCPHVDPRTHDLVGSEDLKEIDGSGGVFIQHSPVQLPVL